MKPASKLTLGPVFFNWPPDKWRDFYFRIADEADLDIVCLGDVVCAKRLPLLAEVVPEVAGRLIRAGKQVVYSSLALVMGSHDIEAVRALARDADMLIEANDLSAVTLLAGRPHIIGPFINTYNEGTLAFFAARGAVRVALPTELSAEALRALAPAEVDLEVQVFGQASLAVSARCYHARSRNLHKDNCQFVCGEDAGGMRLDTLDGEKFLVVNGTQTLSHRWLNLIAELAALEDIGIRYFRLSPQDMDMARAAGLFRDVLDGRREAGAALEVLDGLAGGVPFANGFYHGAAGVDWLPSAA